MLPRKPSTGAGSGPRRAVPAALVALAAALALGACDATDSGGENISPGAAVGLQGALADVDGAAEADNCEDARDGVELFRERLDALEGVDGEIRDSLEAGAERLDALVRSGICEEEDEQTTTTIPEETTTEEPDDEADKDREKREREEEKERREKGGDSPGDGGGPVAPPGQEEEPAEPEGEDGDGGGSGTGGTGGVGEVGIGVAGR